MGSWFPTVTKEEGLAVFQAAGPTSTVKLEKSTWQYLQVRFYYF